jgi:hypothetical protein
MRPKVLIIFLEFFLECLNFGPGERNYHTANRSLPTDTQPVRRHKHIERCRRDLEELARLLFRQRHWFLPSRSVVRIGLVGIKPSTLIQPKTFEVIRSSLMASVTSSQPQISLFVYEIAQSRADRTERLV